MLASLLRAVLIAVSATNVAASCAYGTHLAPRAETGTIKVNTFGYSGSIGPSNWHKLNTTTNAECAVGTNQSPINMITGQFTEVPGSKLKVVLPNFEGGAEFENLGTTVEVVGEGGNLTITSSNKTFDFAQFHFHLPSEHLDNGTSMAMEMHMVFSNSQTAEIAVLGVYIDVVAGSTTTKTEAEKRAADAETSTMLETVFSSVGQIATPGTAVTTPAFEMAEVVSLLSSTTFKSYSGSLTTPPCSEGVNWFVAQDTLSLSLSSWKAARDVIGFNSRFAQNALGETNVLSL